MTGLSGKFRWIERVAEIEPGSPVELGFRRQRIAREKFDARDREAFGSQQAGTGIGIAAVLALAGQHQDGCALAIFGRDLAQAIAADSRGRLLHQEQQGQPCAFGPGLVEKLLMGTL